MFIRRDTFFTHTMCYSKMSNNLYSKMRYLSPIFLSQKCKVNEDGYDVAFNPTIDKHDFCGFFIFPTCWGSFTNKIDSKNGCVKVITLFSFLILKNFLVEHGEMKFNLSVLFFLVDHFSWGVES